MKVANISEAKNQLSALLEKVKHGETVLILDRNVPVACLVPVGREFPADETLARLVREGVVSPPSGKLPADFFKRPRAKLPKGVSAVRALLAEREEGR